MILTVTQQRIKRVYEDISNVLYGKEIADAFGLSDSRITQIKGDGNGPLLSIVNLIREIDCNGHHGDIRYAEKAIKEVVDIVCDSAGYIAVNPIHHVDDIADYLEGIERLTSTFSDLIRELKESILESSENGKDFSESELQRIDKTVRDLCRAALSINLWARKQQPRP